MAKRLNARRSHALCARLSNADHMAGPKAARGAMRGGIRVQGCRGAITITTARASARRTCQTAYLRLKLRRRRRRRFWRGRGINIAHPITLLLQLLMRHDSIHWSSGRVPRNGLAQAGRAWAAIVVRAAGGRGAKIGTRCDRTIRPVQEIRW